MGSVHMHLDLSHADEVREDRLLATDMREHGEIPANHFWQTMYQHYRDDIAETGNDLRFRHHHRWIDDEFRRYDRELRDRDHQPLAGSDHFPAPTSDGLLSLSSMPLMLQTSADGPVPASQPAIGGSIPEPSGLVLIGVGLVGAWVAWGRRKAVRARGGSRRHPGR
jgi:hypothetical protein